MEYLEECGFADPDALSRVSNEIILWLSWEESWFTESNKEPIIQS